jgi:hypothetical protein
LPKLGDTITTADTTGVLMGLTWSASGEQEQMTVSMIDYNSAVLQ